MIAIVGSWTLVVLLLIAMQWKSTILRHMLPKKRVEMASETKKS